MTAITGGVRTRAGASVGDFYTWMFLACLLTAFLGFIPTFWQPLAAGQFQAHPVVFFHGVGFFSWTIFALVQSSFVPAGRVALHRATGLAGISFATLLTVFGCLAALNSLLDDMAAGRGAAAEAFLTVPLSVIATFAVLFGAAVANIRRPEWHKRLMLLATISVLNAPVARPLIVWVYKLAPDQTPPVSLDVPACLLSYLLIVPPLIYDWRTTGRIHKVYLIAVPILVATPFLMAPLADTAAWHGFARFYASLSGLSSHRG